MASKLQISQYLSLVHGKNGLDGFDFHDDTASHQQVKPKPGVESNTVVFSRHTNLALDDHPTLLQTAQLAPWCLGDSCPLHGSSAELAFQPAKRLALTTKTPWW